MATELAKAYVQIVPSAQGITGKIGEALGNEPVIAGQKAGASLGSALIGKLTAVVAAAKIGQILFSGLTSSLSEGGSLQQSLGGVETLFKDSAEAIKTYADEAYRTAGVSANSYMEQVTSFSATLLQGLEGDTEKAVEVANMAMVDMADNANKFGTDIQLVQNAYQGFAKDNYDMLDNLKLGYGGTQAEMARLINDSGVLGDAIEVTAETVRDVPFDLIIEAIHQIQTDLGITGTTAQEAATTLQGSFASMQAAARNLAGNLALGEDVKPAMEALVETASTYLLDNLLPAVGNVISGVPEAISAGLSSAGPIFGNWIFQQAENLKQNAPAMAEAALVAVGQFILGIFDNADEVVALGGDLVIALVTGIASLAFRLPEAAVSLVQGILDTWNNNAENWGKMGKNIIYGIRDGIKNSAADLWENIKQLAENIGVVWDKLIHGEAVYVGDFTRGLTSTVQDSLKVVSNASADAAEQAAMEWQAAEEAIADKAAVNAFIMENLSETTGKTVSDTADRIAEFAQKTAESGTEATKKAVEKQKTLLEQLQEAYQKAYAAPQLRQSIAQLEYDIWAKTAGEAATKAEDLAEQLESLGKQQAAQKEIVAAAQLAYDTYIASQDATEEGALELYKTLLEETDAYEALQDEIDAATDAMAEQQDAAKQLSGALGDVLSDLGDVGGGVSKLGSLLGSDFLSGVGGFISDIASGVTTIVGLSGSIEGLVASAGTLGESLGPLLSSVAGEGLGAIAAGLSSAAASLGPVLAAAGPWILGIGGVLGLGGLLVAGISKLFSSSQPTTPDLSGAVGGGYPSDSNSWGPHTVVEMGGVTIQLSGNYNDPELAAQQIAYHLGELVKQRTTVYG